MGLTDLFPDGEIPKEYFEKHLYFSNKTNATEFILMNKPLLSLNDLLKAWGIGKEIKQYYSTAPLFLMFKAQAKLKLNKNE